MSNLVISVENLSKSYRLGQIGTPSPADAFAGRAAGTFAHDLSVWWAEMRGKPQKIRPIRIIRGKKNDYRHLR